MTYVCEDGLTKMEKLHVAQLFNFGHLKAENCGAATEYATLYQSYADMNTMYKHLPKGQEKDDFYWALVADRLAYLKFTDSDVYQKWIGNITKK